jgi:CheY-like chemotaxis protein
VIEDNADAAEMLQLFLELEGHHVAVENSGAVALATAKRSRPDIVLCDIGLAGGMDGYGGSAAPGDRDQGGRGTLRTPIGSDAKAAAAATWEAVAPAGSGPTATPARCSWQERRPTVTVHVEVPISPESSSVLAEESGLSSLIQVACPTSVAGSW